MENQTDTQKYTKSIFIFLQIGIVILSLGLGYLSHQIIQQNRGELALLQQSREILIENAIFELPNDVEVQCGMIRGMLATLDDPNTFFVEPAQHEVQTDQLTGSYGGIGVRLEQDTQEVWRLYPLPDSPAFEAGIQNGDRLLRIDDQEIYPEMDQMNLVAAMRKPVNEELTLTIGRGDETLTFTIERESVPLPSVTQHLLPEAPQIGMVVIHRIASTTTDEIQEGIETLLDQCVSAIILDLRDNGGGLVDAGVEIAGLFLEKGEIIHQQFKGQEIEIFSVNEPGLFTESPLVVLVNGNTASSAEILSGALQNHHRAVLIGSPTYNKTSIQLIFDLHDGSSIHITSGRWWIPGLSFPLSPDIDVNAQAPPTDAVRKAIVYLQEFLE